MKRETGFTLIELLVTMVIVGLVMAMTSDMLIGMLRGFRQQNKITETNIAGITGLEMLRRDIDSAGYGLPWEFETGYEYSEATNTTAALYNDSLSSPPRAFMSGFSSDGSAYMVVKAMNLARNDACTMWDFVPTTGAGPSAWTSTLATDNFQATDRVVLISPGVNKDNDPAAANLRKLVNTGLYSDMADEYSPEENRIIYGVDPDNLRMPFNRADYYLDADWTPPGRCHPDTKVLVKAVVSQHDGGFDGVNMFPLLDCVADMQVVTYLNDGTSDLLSNGLPPTSLNAVNAATIRTQLKEIHIYILAHEGQRDDSFSYAAAAATIRVGESATLGRDFDLSTISQWQHYRWKIYTLVVRPSSLR